MKTIDIEIAVMGYLDIRANMIVPNASWGVARLHECDLLSLSKTGYATEIEIKITKSDLLKDKEKKHGHEHNHIKYLFFAVPKKLEAIALKEIPERAGLYVIEKYWWTGRYPHFRGDVGEWLYKVTQVRGAITNKRAIKWSEAERLQLARLGAMRILGLKKKIAS